MMILMLLFRIQERILIGILWKLYNFFIFQIFDIIKMIKKSFSSRTQNHKIIIQWQIELKIVLFFSLEF